MKAVLGRHTSSLFVPAPDQRALLKLEIPWAIRETGLLLLEFWLTASPSSSEVLIQPVEVYYGKFCVSVGIQ